MINVVYYDTEMFLLDFHMYARHAQCGNAQYLVYFWQHEHSIIVLCLVDTQKSELCKLRRKMKSA